MKTSIPPISRTSAFVALGLASLLAACGGGNETAQEEPATTASDAAAPTVQVLAPTSSAISEVIAMRAAGRPVFEHRRLIESERARPAREGEALLLVLHVLYDPARDMIVASGGDASGLLTEDIRLIEHAGALHVVRDLYLGPIESTEFRGRGIPALLEGEDFFGDSADRSKAMSASQSDSQPASTAAAAPLATAPALTSLSGVTSTASGISNGRVAMNCGTLYNGARVVNDTTGTYPWTITGANFGASGGSVTVAGRSAKVNSWSSTQIKIDPTVPTSWGAMSTTFTVQTAAGTKGTFGVAIAPSIKSRIFGQCTNHVAWRRLNLGLQPSPSAYGGYSSIAAAYLPRVGDQFQWGGQHTAIVTAVSVSTSGAYKTYMLTVSEQNAACTNAVSNYTTRFQTKSTSSGLVVTERPRSSISKFASLETLYYR